MDSFFDLRVWGLILLWRVILGALVVIPLLYFIVQICLDYPAANSLKAKGLSRHVAPTLLKKLFHSPWNILLACVWMSATVYVFGYAYIWPLGAKALPYKIFEIDDEHRNTKISLILEHPFASLSGGDVAATCMAAGKYYAQKLGRDPVMVKVYAFPPSGFYYGRDAMLGQCTYTTNRALDCEIEECLPMRATSHVSPIRLKINQLWGSLADDFRKSAGIAVLDDKALRKKISQLTGVPRGDAKMEEIPLQPVVGFLLPSINAEGPLNPEREKHLPQLMKIKDFADRLRLWLFDWCFFLDEKTDPARKKAILEKLQTQLGQLGNMIQAAPTLPARLQELPGLFNEYADSCARGAHSELALSKIFTIVHRE